MRLVSPVEANCARRQVTTGMGIACFLLVVASSAGRDRLIVGIYAVVTTLVGLAFIAAGRVPTESETRAQTIAVEPVSDQKCTISRELNVQAERCVP